MKRIQLILIILCVFSKGNASVQPEIVVKSFGENLSLWCSTYNISYREKIDELCSGTKSCRVADKIHAEYQKKKGFTNFETFVLDSYMSMFQALISKRVEYQMSNVKVEKTDMMPDGQLTFVTADIKVSGPINYSVTDLFLVREGKITGIYNYSSQLGFSHLNGSLIRALKVGRYTFDKLYEGIGCGFRNGYAKICNEVGKSGLIDYKGNVIIPCMWDEVFYYGGDFATGSNEIGHIMRTYDLRFKGKVVPAINFFADGQASNCFVDGYMKVVPEKDGYYGFLSEKDLSYNIQGEYNYATDFYNGYAFVSKDGIGRNDGKGCIIDKTFKVLFESNAEYEICSTFHEGLARIRNNKNNKYGFMDTNGHVVIPCIFDYADDFSEELCAVYKDVNNNTLVGFINKSGEVVIPIEYEGCFMRGGAIMFHYFKDGYIDVRKVFNKKEHGTLLGKNGKPLHGFGWEYDRIYRLNEGKARFIENGKWGFLNKNGQIVIPAKYDYVSDYINGYASVRIKINGIEKWGAINHDGVIVIPCIYDNEITFENGVALVSLDGMVGLIDAYGNCSF